MQKVILKYCALKFVFMTLKSGVGVPPCHVELAETSSRKAHICNFSLR